VNSDPRRHSGFRESSDCGSSPVSLICVALLLLVCAVVPGVAAEPKRPVIQILMARQEDVWRNVIEQRVAGTRSLIGMMVESYLEEGNQPFPKPATDLRYGVSITDACIGWETTERLLRWGAEQLAQAR